MIFEVCQLIANVSHAKFLDLDISLKAITRDTVSTSETIIR